VLMPGRVVGQAVGTNYWFVPSNRPSTAFYTISAVWNSQNLKTKITRK